MYPAGRILLFQNSSEDARSARTVLRAGIPDRRHRCILARHGSFTPAILTASAQSEMSDAIMAANSSGVLPSGSTP